MKESTGSPSNTNANDDTNDDVPQSSSTTNGSTAATTENSVAATTTTTTTTTMTTASTITTTVRSRILAQTSTTTRNGFVNNILSFQGNETKNDNNDHDFRFDDSFPQGCQFSPDGLCVLTSRCNRLELYNTPSPIQVPQQQQEQQSEGKEKENHDNNNDDDDDNKCCDDSWKPVLICNKGGDTVRSYTWYPHMNSSDPSTCCFAGVSRDQPVHLYDAYTGGIRATYRPYNALDELESPTVLCFIDNGTRLAMGGFHSDRMIHIFDLNRPGRDSSTILKLGKTRRSKDGQKGLVSAMTATTATLSSLSPNILAVGTYSPGSIYLYDLRAQSTPVSEIFVSGTCIVGHGKSHSRKRKHFATNYNNLNENDDDDDPIDFFSAAKIKWYQGRARGGVTQVEFSNNNFSLFSISRRSNAVLEWDLRQMSSLASSSLSSFCPGISSFETKNDTNQRIQFTLQQQHLGTTMKQLLWVGGQDECIRIYDCSSSGSSSGSGSRNKNNNSSKQPMAIIHGFPGVVNGVSVTSSSTTTATTSMSGQQQQQQQQQTLVSVACGSRQFPSDDDWDQDDPYASATATATQSSNCGHSSAKHRHRAKNGMLQLLAVTFPSNSAPLLD